MGCDQYRLTLSIAASAAVCVTAACGCRVRLQERGVAILRKNTLVCITAEDSCISIRTVSRSGKSPHRFYILRSRLDELESKSEVIGRDIGSFAVLHRDFNAGTVGINFIWLNSDGYNVSGHEETVTVPYDKFAAFIHDSNTENGPKEWKVLSMDNSGKRPQIVFNSQKNLHAALANGAVRRKLVRYLRDQFRWPRSDRIELFDDFVPYSFGFHEIRDGKTAIRGGLILHRQDDMEKAHYEIHT